MNKAPEEVKKIMGISSCGNEYLFYKSHGNYTEEDLNIKITHTEPKEFRDRLALNAVKYVRKGFDWATGWSYAKITPDMILQRAIFLETIAAVPGMVAAIVRHFRSLRSMQQDGGMMQMFLDEANNERMHLLTFVRMKNPGRMFRAMVIVSQFGFGSLFGLAYITSPKFCHRFVGYVEEEACATYTKIIGAVESAEEGTELASWRTQLAPPIARSYWKLGETGTVLEMFYAIRADEAEHRDVNHLCSNMDGSIVTNPVSSTEQHLNTMLLKYIKEMMNRPQTPELQRT
jgi:Alternative oxidase